jgi:hypothetical protein
VACQKSHIDAVIVESASDAEELTATSLDLNPTGSTGVSRHRLPTMTTFADDDAAEPGRASGPADAGRMSAEDEARELAAGADTTVTR